MQSILIFAVLLFATNAFAQDAPQVGPVQVKPKGPGSCKPLGTVEGTKLWAGDCVGVPKRNGGPLDARAQRRNEARRPLDARSPEDEKTW